MTEITTAQAQRWAQFKLMAKRLDFELQAANLRGQNFVLASNYAASIGAAVPPRALLDELTRINQTNERLKEAIIGVELGDLGLRFRGNEIDIMAPPDANADLLAKYPQFGISHILIGIAIGAALVTAVAAYITRTTEIESKLSVLTDEMDSHFCADESSAECHGWQDLKNRENFEERKNLIDRAKDAAKDFPDNLANIAQSIATILIPIAVIVVAYMWGKR